MLTNLTLKHLPYARALNPKHPHRPTDRPLGVNMLSGYFREFNNMLPTHLQVSKPTPHSGRATFSTLALGADVHPELVAKATHHKDLNQLKLYHHAKPKELMKPALAIGKSLLPKDPSVVAGLKIGGDERGSHKRKVLDMFEENDFSATTSSSRSEFAATRETGEDPE